jgi:hypothetical protein
MRTHARTHAFIHPTHPPTHPNLLADWIHHLDHDAGAEIFNSTSKSRISFLAACQTSVSAAANPVSVSVDVIKMKRRQVEPSHDQLLVDETALSIPMSLLPSVASSSSFFSCSPKSSSFYSTLSEPAHSLTLVAPSLSSLKQSLEHRTVYSHAPPPSIPGSSITSDAESHWLGHFFSLASERFVVSTHETFDSFLLSRRHEFHQDRGLADSFAIGPDGFTCFSEYCPIGEVLQLMQFQERPPKYVSINANVWRARPAECRIDDDICVCHDAIPSALLSRWQNEQEERRDSPALAVKLNERKPLAGKRSTREHASSFSVAATNTSLVPVSSSSSSSQSSSGHVTHLQVSSAPASDIHFLSTSVAPSLGCFANDSAQTRAFEKSAFSSVAAMRRACCGAESCLNRACKIECPVSCIFGQRCENRRFTRQQNAEMEARPTFDKGWGLFACAPVEADTFMIEYCGEVIQVDECERRIHEALRHVVR